MMSCKERRGHHGALTIYHSTLRTYHGKYTMYHGNFLSSQISNRFNYLKKDNCYNNVYTVSQFTGICSLNITTTHIQLPVFKFNSYFWMF